MTRRQGIIGLIVLLALTFALSWWLEHRPVVTVEQAIAHGHTEAAEARAAQIETVYVAAKADVVAGRAILRTLRDTLLEHKTDTLLVDRFITRTDVQLATDSTAIAKADSTLAAQKGVTESVRAELRVALQPHPPPRLVTTASALYDPLSGTPAGSVQVSARVIRSFALVARVDQRAVIGEKPRAYVGIALSF